MTCLPNTQEYKPQSPKLMVLRVWVLSPLVVCRKSLVESPYTFGSLHSERNPDTTGYTNLTQILTLCIQLTHPETHHPHALCHCIPHQQVQVLLDLNLHTVSRINLFSFKVMFFRCSTVVTKTVFSI